jgi:hypothetical protein
MKPFIPCSLLPILLLAAIPAQAAVWHQNKQPLGLQMDASRPCAFFRLEGVAVADPAVNSQEWFALTRSHPAFAELWAALVTAKAGKLPIDVKTLGTEACGHAAVDIVVIP